MRGWKDLPSPPSAAPCPRARAVACHPPRSGQATAPRVLNIIGGKKRGAELPSAGAPCSGMSIHWCQVEMQPLLEFWMCNAAFQADPGKFGACASRGVNTSNGPWLSRDEILDTGMFLLCHVTLWIKAHLQTSQRLESPQFQGWIRTVRPYRER